MEEFPEKLSEEDNDDLFEHYRIVVDPGQSPLRIDKFLSDRLPNASRNKIQSAINEGFIQVNNSDIKSNYKVRPKDIVTVSLPEPPRDTEVVPEDIPLDIRYEDQSLMIVNKPPGMVVHPAFNNWTGTLVNALVYHFKNLPEMPDNEGRPGLVHRIDKDTSGLLVIAKTEHALNKLARQFFDHSIERTYWALVWGIPEPSAGTIQVPIGRSLRDRRIMMAYPDGEQGKSAVTHYRILTELRYVSLVECRLETGRTHQIRAHMKYLGHPVFNDSTYGGDKILKGTIFSKYRSFVQNCFQLIPRQALHAKTLGFIHPDTGKRVNFDSGLPDDLSAVIEKWENYVKYV
jgi:23S rRNA pseudouridine1911/1915/1917 synthase